MGTPTLTTLTGAPQGTIASTPTSLYATSHASIGAAHAGGNATVPLKSSARTTSAASSPASARPNWSSSGDGVDGGGGGA